MIFGINTTRDISKLSQISVAKRPMKLRITILKYHSWYLCQISLQIMLLPILAQRHHYINFIVALGIWAPLIQSPFLQAAIS